jgi:hypothetical protein
MPNPNIDQLLDELYLIDPSLRGQESQVRTALERLMRQTPSLTLSPTTIQKIQTTMMEQPTSLPRRPLPKMFWAGVPLAIAAVTAGILLIPEKAGPKLATQKNSKVSIISGPAAAFGSFTAAQHVNRSSTTAESTSTKDSAGGAMVLPSIGIVPPSSTVVYSYTGTFAIPQSPVLQRERGFSAGSSIAAGGVVDLSSLSGLRLDYVTATQQTDDGYTVTIDYREGCVSMYKQSASMVDIKSATSIAPDRPVAQTTMSLEKAITVAKAFAGKHGIDLLAYDVPCRRNYRSIK